MIVPVESRADLIGLSGLITPSLEEMVHVAREMQRQGLEVPLLIGGATTSRAHTAVRISPPPPRPRAHLPRCPRGGGGGGRGGAGGGGGASRGRAGAGGAFGASGRRPAGAQGPYVPATSPPRRASP